jgi:hypothetical protein
MQPHPVFPRGVSREGSVREQPLALAIDQMPDGIRVGTSFRVISKL